MNNLIVNGDFSIGSTVGWVETGTPSPTYIWVVRYNSMGYVVISQAEDAVLTQTVSGLENNKRYLLKFTVNYEGDENNNFVFINNQVVINGDNAERKTYEFKFTQTQHNNRTVDKDIIFQGCKSFDVTNIILEKIDPYSGEYKNIADNIDAYQKNGDDIIDSFDNILEDISLSDVPSTNRTKIEFYDVFNESRTSFYNRHKIYSRNILDFVGNMQRVVLEQFSSIDEYLVEIDEKVKEVFADISSEAGYPIDISNIEGDIS